MRVDSESALIKFINQLKSAGIDIPENLTFEFDSQELQFFFNELANHYLQPPFDGVNIFSPDNNITEFIYFGHKMKLKQQLTPIELPSDEEVHKSSPHQILNSNNSWDIGFHNGWKHVAKWMRDKIQGGDQ